MDKSLLNPAWRAFRGGLGLGLSRSAAVVLAIRWGLNLGAAKLAAALLRGRLRAMQRLAVESWAAEPDDDQHQADTEAADDALAFLQCVDLCLADLRVPDALPLEAP